ncbi:hypothetical protein J8I26_02835 [Herbaspirillum sp. LeCh32-8]|uniref:hypothetical protein n=1 Tax=Herbaspirillum sp. LeCh32-8 TaxID=2821356 RepID=UPI001AE1F1B0|nr:hypothetical protein [Herbaspirillum sp. LeCh32-8]MBP0597021.1 hypothetical protein [Herbaspirillum sp. LeCh32-8]
MRYSWTMVEVPVKTPTKNHSPWLFVVLFVVLQILGIVLCLITWPEGKAPDILFWIRLLMPTMAWIMVSCILLGRIEMHQMMEKNWRCLRQQYAIYRQNWAQLHWVVSAVAVVTPEADVAERLLGLEGARPENPGKNLSLPLDGDGNGDRCATLLMQLLSPLAEAIRAAGNISPPRVYLLGNAIDDEAALALIWKELDLPRYQDLLKSPPDPFLFDGTHQNPSKPCNVILSYQLQERADDASNCSELGAGLVFITDEVANMLKMKVRTVIMRPIESETEMLGESLRTLSQGRQTDWTALRHTWISRLGKPARNAARAAVHELAPNAALHDVDHALGKAGESNGWLQQALAVQMVKHGQGDQLVISSRDADNVTCNLLTAKPLPPLAQAGYVVPLSNYLCLAFFVPISVWFVNDALQDEATIASPLIMLGLSLGTMVFLMLVGILFTHLTARDFWRKVDGLD